MKQDIEKLLEKYYEGETTLDEERQLREFFQKDPIPPHLESHAAPFRYFAQTRKEHPSVAFTNRWTTQLEEPKGGWVRNLTTLLGWRMAASVALLIVGFAGGMVYQSGRLVPEDAAVDEAALAMKKTLTFSQRPITSASERIQAVNQIYELDQVDHDITQLLINTLNFDANVNVRLAACQALLRFENEPGVREALIQSLSIQTDPNVQLTLIEALVAMKEKRAVSEMQRLARNQQVLDIVRLKAEEGLSRLI